MRHLILASLCLAALTACNKSADVPPGAPQAATAPSPAFQPFAVTDSANARQIAPGVRAYIIELGKGEVPKAGQEVLVNYHGMFESGQAFDSSMDPAFGHVQPFSFLLGQGQVIKGWDLSIAALPVGTKAKVVIAPDLAYGPDGRGPIPPNSTLVFDIHILGANAAPAAQ